MTGPQRVHIVGAGRMGQGIAQAFAFGGIPVSLIDVKDRTAEQQRIYFADIRENLEHELRSKIALGRLSEAQSREVVARVQILSKAAGEADLVKAVFAFEAVPEVLAAKRDTLTWLSEAVTADCVIASTTSTFLVTELAEMVTQGGRFVNAHWLNPADVVPLIEISRSKHTDEATIRQIIALLESIGKVPVVCSASAGYIVPRLQALAMNEAARMVEEGVASAEDIDKAVRVGFGFRFSVMGMLEFIDWGGGDILHYASQYLSKHFGARYEAPSIISSNMSAGRTGVREGDGFYKYDPESVSTYKLQRTREFWEQLDHIGLAPLFNSAMEFAQDAADT